MLALVEGLVVMAAVVVALIVLVNLISKTDRPGNQVSAGARWVATHYSVRHSTRVVVRKIRIGTSDVLDEHVIAELTDTDPEYDTKFLEAMAQARARVALYESEPD